jgi:hypothetical protein
VLVGAAVAAKPGSGSSTRLGSVFVSNPVQSLGDESLTDQRDADAAVPAAGYHDVRLTNLDGSGFLSGDYAKVVSETGNRAYSPTNTFRYTRHHDEFEQVMAYYWVTEAQRYIHTRSASASRAAGSTTGRRRSGSTSGASTTRLQTTVQRTRCASAKAASTTRRTPR